MRRSRLLAFVLCLILAAPAGAWAQGAGDDQYQDPFGDAPAQTGGGGLSDTPPGAGSGGGNAGSADPAPAPPPEGPASAPEAPHRDTLPYTGADARLLALLAVSMLMVGIGLRLRSIDPDAF